MLNRALTKKEELLLLIITAALLSFIYYRFVRLPVQQRIAAADTTEIETEMEAEQIKAMRLRKMQEEIDENKLAGKAEIATYNNFNAEAAAMNQIFLAAKSYNFTYNQPVAKDNLVRRTMTINFVAANYKTAQEILRQIHDCPFRTLIRDFNITASGDSAFSGLEPDLSSSEVSVSLNVTFFETLFDAETKDGLDIQDETASSDGSAEGDSSEASGETAASTS